MISFPFISNFKTNISEKGIRFKSFKYDKMLYIVDIIGFDCSCMDEYSEFSSNCCESSKPCQFEFTGCTDYFEGKCLYLLLRVMTTFYQ